MSTPDQPGGLTRKQLREIRKTGVVPVIDPDAAPDATTDREPDVEASAAGASSEASAHGASPDSTSDVGDAEATSSPAADTTEPAGGEPAAGEPATDADVAPVPAVHLPRAAEPAVAAPPPPPDSQVDLGAVPLTRRQARNQERIRTASVPVIGAAAADEAAGTAAAEGASWPPVPTTPAAEAAGGVADAEAAGGVAGAEAEATGEADAEPVDAAAGVTADPEAAEVASAEDAPSADAATVASSADESETEEAAEPEGAASEPAEDESAERPVLRPEFGAAVLAGDEAPATPLPPSFDELIARSSSTTGSVATPSALILTQTAGVPLTSPVTATGEVLITGTFNLPDGLGSQGHAPGAADGKDVDSVLIDGELPAASSPTPIAASAAISTVTSGGEIIRPPAPEKGNKLMLTLAITAGVLALALVGVLIFALATGVF